MNLLVFITFLISFITLINCNGFFSNVQVLQFQDYTKYMKNVNLTGYMATFGDFNADRTTDIFIKHGSSVEVILMPKKDSYDYRRIKLLDNSNIVNNARNIVVGDFNGDSLVDILLYNFNRSISIAYGKVSRDSVDSLNNIDDSNFESQPIHIDYNADMIGDIIGLDKDYLKVLIGNKNNSFTLTKIVKKSDIVADVGDVKYIQFFDVNADKQADIVFIGILEGEVCLSSLIKEQGRFNTGPKLKTGVKVHNVGQPVIGDFDFNGSITSVAPFCEDAKCQKSGLLGCSYEKSGIKCNSVTFENEEYRFESKIAPKQGLDSTSISQLNCADIYLTGYMDCIVPMMKTGNEKNELVKLKNNGGLTKGFKVEKFVTPNSELTSNIVQAAVFDLEEDGVPDILTTTKNGVLVPLHQDTPADSYFIKVMVLNGLCNNLDNCPGAKLPYGIPLPGVVVSYESEGAVSGKAQSSISTQCPDSSYTSLQLPYTLFGLGSFANYVEKLAVTIPQNQRERTHYVTFIVPKTQIVIIPYPLDNPEKWSNKLFLEPFLNHKVIYVAAALLGTMLIVAIVLCILQYLEIRADRQEKMAEAQKFHFDAM